MVADSALVEATKTVYQIYWDTLISFLSKHWIAVTLLAVIILIIALVKAILGRWGMLGSILYHYFYFGILLIVGLIWGSNIFVSDFFHLACTILLYPACYFLVGVILNKTGLRTR